MTPNKPRYIKTIEPLPHQVSETAQRIQTPKEQLSRYTQNPKAQRPFFYNTASMSSNDNTSTLGSYIDSAKGAAQSMLGSITGNQADKARLPSPLPSPFPSPLHPLPQQTPNNTPLTHPSLPTQTSGEATRTQAQHEKAGSDTIAKLGPIGISPSGGMSADDPKRSEGSWNQTIGSGKEMLGNAVGAEGLKREGIEQNRQGKGQEAEGQLSDLGSGVQDRVGGKVGAVVASVKGDREREEAERARHDGGKTLQRSAEGGIQRRADY